MTLALRVAQVEADIIADEGECHVAGRYYAKAGDAAKARRIEAERRVRGADRMVTLRQLLDTRWEITTAGLFAVLEDIHPPEWEPQGPACLIGHDGVCRTHDEPCLHTASGWVCAVGEMAS